MSIRKDAGDIVGIILNGADDIVGEIADAGRRAYCSLYSQAPYWVMTRNNFIVPVVTRTLDNFCADFPPPPPPPPPPFTGGQCEGVPYRVRAAYSFTVSGSSQVHDRDEILSTVQGKIQSISTNGDTSAQTIIINILTTASATPIRVTKNLGFGSSLVPDSLVVSFPTVDGSPDLCGDPPPPGYEPIPDPDDSDLTKTVNITNIDGDSYDYDVTINRDPGNTVVFPPSITVNGVNLTIDIGGINISSKTIKFSGGGGGSSGDTLAPEGEDAPPETVEEEKNPDETPDPVTTDRLVAIVVNLVSIPSNAHVIDGRGAPNVYYAGWIAFKNKNKYYEREFINFNGQRFQAPDENDGYAVTYKIGYSGQITEIREEAVE